MSDYITGLRQDLVEAAARRQAAGRGARVTRPLRPRAWSPAVVVGAVAALAAIAVLVLALRAVSPPRPPEAPRRLGTLQIGGAPRDAAAVAGAVVVADFDGRLVRLTPGRSRAVVTATAGANLMSIASDGTDAWVSSLAPPQPHPRLVQVYGRGGRLGRTIPLDAESDAIAVGAGGLWLHMPSGGRRWNHEGILERIDPRTGRRTAVVRSDAQGLAASDQSVWTRNGETVTQRDEQGRVVSRVRHISPTVGLEGQRTMVADDAGAWVVGQSDGLLYRIEDGRVVEQLRVGLLSGAIARSRSAVWVTALVGTGRYELVRVDPEDATVTGRVALGSVEPQTVVPIGREVWVITARGAVLRFSQG